MKSYLDPVMHYRLSHVAAALFIIIITFIACSTGLEPVSGLSGTVTFHGTWPDTLAGAVVAAYVSIPENLETPADGMSDIITAGLDSSEYFIQLNPAYYSIIIVAGVKPDSSAVLLKIAGSTAIDEGSETTGHNIQVEFR